MHRIFISIFLLFIASVYSSCSDKTKEPAPPFIPLPEETPTEDIKMITPTTIPAEVNADIKGLRYWPGMQINVKSMDFFKQRLDEVAEAGFKYVELKFKYACGFEKMTDEQINEYFADIQRQITGKDISIWSIHLPYEDKTWTNIGGEESIRRQSVDYLLRILRLCVQNFPECRNYVLHASKGVLSPRSASVEQARKSLEEMLPVAKTYGVQLCVENLVGSLCPTPDEKWAVLKDFDDVRSTFDIGHANCTGHDVIEFMRWEGTKLGTVHIHDTIFKSNNDDHRLVGKGDIGRWGQVYRTLLNTNRYRGVFMFEPSDNQSAKEVMATYDAILQAYSALK